VPAPAVPDADVPADPATAPGRRRVGRRTRAFALAVAPGLVAVTAIVVWHLPAHRYLERPGGVLDLATRIEIADDTPTTPIDGRFDGLTVRLEPLDLGGLVLHRLRGDPSVVVPEDEVRPPAIDPAAYHAYERAAFVDGGQVAAAVAERALGYRVGVTSDGLEVFRVSPRSAADGRLRAGDAIVAVDGRAVALDTDLADAVAAAAGRPLTLAVRHQDGTTATLSLVPTVPPGGDRAVLGVVVGPTDPTVDLAVPVTIDAEHVEGPSAGLMTALTVYDELSSVDVAAGRTIAGTGTLAIDGTVGEIGGIEAKARAAEAAGAQLFLAPATQADAARTVLGDRVPVVGVRSFEDALAALTDAGAPT
jgi:PDZ domain-containing protein